MRREGDGEGEQRFDTGHDAARFGKLFEPVRQVLHGGSSPGVRNHLIDRMRDRKISMPDLNQLRL